MASDGRAYPGRPLLGVGGVVLVDNQVVLIRRRNPPLAGRWSLPGGVVEAGESVQAAVAREVLEETGLTVRVRDLVEVVEHIDHDQDGRVRHHYVILDYLCDVTGGTLRAGGDVDAAALIKPDPDTMDAYALTDAARRVISRGLQLHNVRERPSG
jgi:ADP-ribose pyrophosphatase YjhB (NUDIX family)